MRPLSLAGAGLCLSVTVYAQTGPGGVGSGTTNILWLDANYGVTAPTLGVSSWSDRSGTGNTVTQGTGNKQPVYVTNAINGYPTVQFDNDQTNPDYLSKADNGTLEGMSGLTAFCVYQLATGTTAAAPRCFFSKRNAPDDQEAYSWFLYNGGGSGTTISQYLDIDGTNNRTSGSSTYTTGTTYISGFVYDGTPPSNSTDQVLYDGNTAVGNAQESSTSVPNYTSDLYIGSLRGHTGTGANTTRFNGNISEVIMYNYALGSAQRIIVNNYLAAKYGTTLASNDLYVQDNPANGNYDHDVAGIGRISASDLQTDSKGSGMVEMLNPTGLDNNEFCFWGHNNGTLTTIGNSDYPSGLQGRLNRVWRTSEVTTAGATTDVGAVDLIFHLSGTGLGASVSSLRLLVDANNNGIFSDDTPISGAVFLGNGKYKFAGVTALSNGLRFTLGTTNTNTSLPIELLSFSAANEGDHVLVEWATATEQNNELFTVERSADGAEWDAIGEHPGAGNSSFRTDYALADEHPVSGTSYYRLRQTDVDGTSTLSPMVAVERSAPTLIYPMPSAGRFTVVMPPGKGEVHLFDGEGRALSVAITYDGNNAQVDAAALPPGTYYLLTGSDPGAVAHRVVLYAQ